MNVRTLTAFLMIAFVATCQTASEEDASAPDVGADAPPSAQDTAPAPEPPSTSDVVLRVEPAQASAGDTVELVLRNDSGARVGYNLCTSALERREGEVWGAVPSDRVCTMELRTLEPGQDARYSLELPQDLPAGTYRAMTNVERMDTGARGSVVSDEFEVG